MPISSAPELFDLFGFCEHPTDEYILQTQTHMKYNYLGESMASREINVYKGTFLSKHSSVSV